MFAKEPTRFGFGLLILPKTETQWIFRNLVFCNKPELPSKTRENAEFGLAQFVSRHISNIVDYRTRNNTRTLYRIAQTLIDIQTVVRNSTTEDCQIREVL